MIETSKKPSLSSVKTAISDIRLFRKTRFYPAFRLQFRCSLLLPILSLVLLILGIIQKAFVGPLFALFLLILLFWALYWIQIYHLVVFAAPSLEEIEHNYSLMTAETRSSYQEALRNVLIIADKSIAQEYSIRLLQRQAELEAMKSQINPHFLYNTLDTIRGYAMMENAQITGDMIEILSRLFRYTVSRKKTEVTLSEEISILYDYIKIQEYRTNQRIAVIQNISEKVDTDQYKIPRMVLQPLIENAILHGTVGIAHDFSILISVYPTNYYLVISVKDNGCGMTPETLASLNRKLADSRLLTEENESSIHPAQASSSGRGTGIALTNINQRIKIIYGEKYGLRAYSVYGEGTEFQLLLPFYIGGENNNGSIKQQGEMADES